METLDGLDLLAHEAGIQPGYLDHKGIFHPTSAATKLALLQAMGLLAEDRDPQSVVAARREESRQLLLPKVLVLSADETPSTIPLVLDEKETAGPLHYSLEINGEEHSSGIFPPVPLTPVGQNTSNGRLYRRFHSHIADKIPPGYHRLTVTTTRRKDSTSLIVAPPCCYLPEKLSQGKRLWGIGTEVPSLHSRRNWGIGDFTDIEQLIDLTADIGGDFVGLSPLHALYPTSPNQCNPFSPSNRFFSNFLFIDPDRVGERHGSFTDQPWAAALSQCRAMEAIDYDTVARLKREAMLAGYRNFHQNHLASHSEQANQFRLFKEKGGSTLYNHALYEALQDFFSDSDPSVRGWRQWPPQFHHPESQAVKQFAHRHHDTVEFHCYVLWQAELQLASCGNRSLSRRLGVGLCLEMAAGPASNGAEVWSNQLLYTTDATIGSPPDDNHPEGIDCGLAPPIPFRLVESAYSSFSALLQSTMRFAGALQIVHPQQFDRLYWIPGGGTAKDGAYVNYPLEDLLAVLALESLRNRCVVIAEEGGPATEETEKIFKKKKIFFSRFFCNAKEGDAGPVSPQNFPQYSLTMVAPLGYPTLASFWKGDDIVRDDFAVSAVSEKKRDDILTRRQTARAMILSALDEQKLLPADTADDSTHAPEMTGSLSRAVHRYLARSPAQLVIARLEDIFLLRGYGIPADREHNHLVWQCKFPLFLEEMGFSPALNDIAATIGNERNRDVIAPESRGRQAVTPVIPIATYRLQLNRNFTFAAAAAIVPYLARLGISHCYTSPCFAARSGSSHGYDVVNPNELNSEIGGLQQYQQFNHRLKENGMGQLLDIVPNHMGVMGSDNHWWLDVLENGLSSFYAPFFDIDWEPVKEELRHKILVPVLGEPYGTALEQAKLTLTVDFQNGSFSIFYYDHRFPLDPCTYPIILGRRIDILEIRLGHDAPDLIELHSLITAFSQLPPCTETDPKKILIRRRDKEILKKRLAQLAASSLDIYRQLEETAAEYNNPASTSLLALHALLELQPYRLAYWKVAADEINYRRFFNINDLAAVCVENEQVFEMTHRLILDLVKQGLVEGLRIDHPDGLYDPAEYYQRLTRSLQPISAADTVLPIYLVVEKILAPFEHLPKEWPVHGTTGYDFTNLVNKLFVESSAEKHLLRTYRRFTSITEDFETILYHSKKRIMRLSLASELNVLANRLDRLSELNWQTRDFTLNNLREALSEVAACFPVYRTYVTENTITAQDRNYIDWAIAQAKKNSPAADQTIFDFLHSVLLLEPIAGTDHEFRQAAADFARRFQQFTAPVMAKGLEDTAFYIYNPLISLNEVGGDPRRFGASVAAFHRLCRERAEHWPHSMLATSTHDSKRSEDVRCRINVLSEMPIQWQIRLHHWGKLNRRFKTKSNGKTAPSANDEYLLYQTLLGMWPLEYVDESGLADIRQRVQAYMKKSCREAKMRTSWAEPNDFYEQATSSFIDSLLSSTTNPFLADFLPFQNLIARLGLYNSLSQCLLKLCSPGVPDIYQGCELWNFHLVDPDNRRPVDYDQCRNMLEKLEEQTAHAGNDRQRLVTELFDTIADGRMKLFITWQTLQFRQQQREFFRHSTYLPLSTDGSKAEHVCAFARRSGKQIIIAATARFFLALTDQGEKKPCGSVWAETYLDAPFTAEGCWRNIFTGRALQARTRRDKPVLSLEEVFACLPVAVLKFEAAENDMQQTRSEFF